MRKIELVPRVTPDSAQALWYELEAGFDTTGATPVIELDGAGVRHLSAAALQVILVARQRALRDGGSLVIARASDDLCAGLRHMGALHLLDGVPA